MSSEHYSGLDELYGLVMAGGMSSRMGKDKGCIQYFEKEQRYRLADILNIHCKKVFISIREDQKELVDEDYNMILDSAEVNGPMNGIFSANKAFPDVSWMVMAVDLPLMDEKHILQLLEQRDRLFDAVAFSKRERNLAEPLAAIWEKHGIGKMKTDFQETGNSSPSKYLKQAKTKLVFPNDENVLLNANSTEELNMVKSIINKNKK